MRALFWLTYLPCLLVQVELTHADSIPKLVERRLEMFDPSRLSRDTMIAFTLDDSCELVIVAFNMHGLPVDTIEHAMKGPGTHTAVWSPVPNLPAGKYVLELRCGDLHMSQGVLYGDYIEPYPNPHSFPDSVLVYELSDTCSLLITVRNVLGQPVDTIVQEVTVPGKYRHVWRPKRPAPSGIYFWHLKCGTHEIKKAFMWLKQEKESPNTDD